MELNGWPDEYGAELVNDEKRLAIYGSCAYSITKSQFKRALCDVMSKRSLERIEMMFKNGKYCDC